MIISHKHKFIFIKTRKTAGTSIEVDLNPVLGKHDVATPIMPPVYGHVAKNYKYGLFKLRNLYNHMKAIDVRKYLGEKIYNSYHTFCVEREPVDKCISHYSMIKNSNHHNSGSKHLTFDEYIERRIFPNDYNKYVDTNGHLIVNKILKYENLNFELTNYLQKFNLNINLKTKAKSGFREEIKVSHKQKEIIYEEFENCNLFTDYKIN